MAELHPKNRPLSRPIIAVLALACSLFLDAPCFATDYKMEKQVEMNGQDEASLSGSSYTEIAYPIWFGYTSSQYPSATIYFEAVIKAGSGTAYVALYTTGGSVVSGSEVSTASASYTRVRSSAITLSSGSTYTVRLKNSGAGTTYVKNCRLIVVQNSSSLITATETHVHMSGNNYYSGDSYTEDTGNGLPIRFYYDGNRFSKNVGVYLEAVIKEDDASCEEMDAELGCLNWKIAYVELYDVTYGQQACEVSTNSVSAWERSRSSACSVTTGNEYTIRMKNSSSGNTTYMAGARLVIMQSNTSGIVRTESYYQLATNYKTYTDGSYTQTEHYDEFDPGNWGPTTPTYYHETTYKVSSGTGYVELYNYTDTSSINALSGSATSLTRLRSGSAITMPSAAKTLETREYRSAGTLTITGNRVVVQSTYYPNTTIDTLFSDDTYVFDSTNQRRVVRDAAGIWYVVYVKWEGSRYTVRLARSTDCGGTGGTCTWSSVPLFGYNGIIDSASTSWISPSIEVNAARTQLHLVVVKANNVNDRRLYYAMCPNTANWDQSSGWFRADGTTQGAEEVTSGVVGDPDPAPMVALDSNGYPHVVYERHDYSYPDYYNEISYVKYTGSAWSSITQVTNGSLNGYEYVSPAIDIGYNDLVHIVYVAYANYFGYHRSQFLCCNSSDNFATKSTVIYESNAHTAYNPSIAASRTENKVWVAGFVGYSNYYLRFNYSSDGGTTWSGGSGGTNVSDTGDYRYPVVGLDTGGTATSHRLLVENHSSPYELRSSTWDGSAFPATSSISGHSASAAADANMVSIEKIRYTYSSNMGYAWYSKGHSALYFDMFTDFAPTLITLASFSARTDNGRVTVEWTTKSEIDNLGFNLYRSVNGGAEVKLNSDLIPGLISSVSGEQYTYSDASAPAGTPVCYTLEDIDLKGTRTSHGPACVYWPAPQGVVQEAAQVAPGATQVEVENSTGTAGGAYSLDPRHSTLQQGSSLDTRHSTLDTHPAVTRSRVTAVTVSALTAWTDGKGVLISWKTGHEVNNLGFHVWREEAGQRIRLTREPLAGGALTVGNTHVDAGHSYSFVDTTAHGSRLATTWRILISTGPGPCMVR